MTDANSDNIVEDKETAEAIEEAGSSADNGDAHNADGSSDAADRRSADSDTAGGDAETETAEDKDEGSGDEADGSDTGTDTDNGNGSKKTRGLFGRGKKKGYEFKPENPEAVEAAMKRLEDGMSSDNMTPQMERIAKRQEDETRRVEKAIENTKSNPAWLVPLFSILLILGLLWVVVFYLTHQYPIPAIGNWNLAVGAGISFIGFILLMWWE